MQLRLLKLNHKSLIILRNFLMKNMVLIGIVLLVNNYNSIKENTLTLMYHMRVNTIFSFMKDKWLYCFIKWDDEILMTFYFYFFKIRTILFLNNVKITTCPGKKNQELSDHKINWFRGIWQGLSSATYLELGIFCHESSGLIHF